MIKRTLALAVLSALAGCTAANHADLVVYGPVWSGDAIAPAANAVAIRGDTIMAVGDSADIAALVGSSTRVISGGLVTPGFGDGHVHFSGGGFQLASVDLRDAATPAEFARRIKEHAATLEPGEWITGGDWDHELWGGELPRRQWIDSVTPDNPVFVQRLDGHMGVANSKALELAGVDRNTADIDGGTIIRDGGEPTGLLKDEAMNPVQRVIPDASPTQMDSAVVRAMRFANSKGVTAVSAVSASWAEIASTRRVREAGMQTLRIAFYPSLSQWRAVADSVAANGPGDDWIRVAGVKGMVDGSLGSTTALFFDPYLDEPSSTGLFVTPEESLRTWIGAADSAGIQVVVHAIGDRADALLLDIFDSVAVDHGPRDRRFRIEHAQHLRQEDIPRFARMDVIASMQPYHAADDGRWAWKRIRPAQLEGTYAFRSLIDAGAVVAFGSDWTVAPIDPLLGIWAAVERQTIDGANPDGWYPQQRVTVDQALHSYTVANAVATFSESRWGMIRPGMLADIAVLDRDIRSIPANEIKDARVTATVVGGKVVFEAD